MSAGWLGRARVELATCASTNDEAAERARRGADHGTIVIADAQSAGRGRRGRAWHSPPGQNLYLSCILRPPLEPTAVPPLALVAGVAVAETVNDLGVQTSLKWPNDVLAGEKKLAGILAEMSTRERALEHVVLGIGVNLAHQRFPAALADRATSLALEGASADRDDFLAALLPALEAAIDLYLARGLAPIAARWMARMHRGLVRVGAVEGMQRRIDADGALVVEDAAGALHTIVAGDVELVGWVSS